MFSYILGKEKSVLQGRPDEETNALEPKTTVIKIGYSVLQVGISSSSFPFYLFICVCVCVCVCELGGH